MIWVSALRAIWGNEMLNLGMRLLGGGCLLGMLALNSVSEAQTQNAAAQSSNQSSNQSTGQQTEQDASASAEAAAGAAASQNVPAGTNTGQTAAAADQAQLEEKQAATDQVAADNETEAGGQTPTSISDVELFDPELEQSDEPLDPQQSGGRFIPTEQLSLDLGVSFPVDI